MKDDPSVPSAETAALQEILKLPHALMGGTRAMRAAGTEFLPQADAESNAAYAARLAMSFLFPAYERTIGLLAGQVFDKPITATDEGAELPEDVDLEGNNMSRFGRQVLEAAMQDGSAFILVDVPPQPVGDDGLPVRTTAAEDKAAGRRPYYVLIKAGDMLNVRFENHVLVGIRFRETYREQDPDNEYQDVAGDQIRIIDKGTWTTYRKGDKDEWRQYANGSMPEALGGVVPISEYYLGKKLSRFTTRPPLTGLAELNQEHWISSSDQRNILHTARVPLLFGKLLMKGEKGEVVIAANNLIHGDDPDSDLKYVEHEGAAIDEGWKDLQQLEDKMQLWGLSMVAQQRPGAVTATENALNKAQSNTFLGMAALELQDVLNTAEEYRAVILGEDPVSVSVNTDFSLALSTYSVSTLIEAFKTSLLDRATIVTELKRRGEISDDVDLVDVIAGVEQDARTRAGTMSGIGAEFLS